MKFAFGFSAALFALHATASLANPIGNVDVSFNTTDLPGLQLVKVIPQPRSTFLAIGSVVDTGDTIVFTLDANGKIVPNSGRTYSLNGTLTDAVQLLDGSLILVGNQPAHITEIDSNRQVVFNDGAPRDKVEFNAVTRYGDSFIVAGARTTTLGFSKDFYAAQFDAAGNVLNEYQFNFNLGGAFVDSIAAVVIGNNAALQPRVYFIGSAQTPNIIATTSGTTYRQVCAITAVRLDTWQSDATWGSNPDGKTFVDWSGYTTGGFTDSVCRSAAVQDDGSLVVGGEAYSAVTGPASNPYLTSEWAVTRLRVNGALDFDFGQGGTTVRHYTTTGPLAFNSVSSHSLSLQSDGSIVVGGFASSDFVQSENQPRFPGEIAAARLRPDGTVDFNFGAESGFTTLAHSLFSLPGSLGDQYAVQLLLDNHERPVIVGTDRSQGTDGDVIQTPIVRLQSDYIFSSQLEGDSP